MNRMILILLVALIISACQPTAVVVVTATPTTEPLVIIVTATPTIVPTLAPSATATPSPTFTPTATRVIQTATPTRPSLLDPTPTQEILLPNILENGEMLPPCRSLDVTTRAMEMPASWRPFFNKQALFWRTDTLRSPSEAPFYPFVKCRGWGVDIDISYQNGAFGFETDFDAERNRNYYVKIEYGITCWSNIDKPLDPSSVGVLAQLINSDGGTTTTLSVQNPPALTHSRPVSATAVWLVSSSRPNPAGTLRVFFTMNFAVCAQGSSIYIRSIYMEPTFDGPADFRF